MAFLDGKLIVAGLSSEEFASTLRVIPYPFKEADKGTGIEIFHGAHGAMETRSPIRTFVAYKIGKEDTHHGRATPARRWSRSRWPTSSRARR